MLKRTSREHLVQPLAIPGTYSRLKNPDLDTAFQMWPRQGRGEQEGHLPQPDGHWLAYDQLVPHQDTQFLLHRSCMCLIALQDQGNFLLL